MLASSSISSHAMSTEEVLQFINDWVEENAPPSADQRQRFSALSFALRRHTYFATGAETVRSALSQAETQLKNQQETLRQEIQLASTKSSLPAAESDASSSSTLPSAADSSSRKTSSDGASPQSHPEAGSNAGQSLVEESRPSSVVQEKLEELFNGAVPPDGLQQIDTTDDESYISDSESHCSSPYSSLNESDGEQADGRRGDMIPIRINPSVDDIAKSTLGRVPKVSIAHIAAAPSAPSSVLRSQDSSRSLPREESSESVQLDDVTEDEIDVTVADGECDTDPHAKERG